MKRIVYLGGLVPSGGAASDHLASRLAVEEILLDGVPGSVALRASIVIGGRSRSFRFLVRLVERLPVLAFPGWAANRTQPIDERDIVALLTRAATSDAGGGTLAGRRRPRRRLLRRADHADPRQHARRPPDGRAWAADGDADRQPLASVIAGEQHELIGPLMESLESDLLPRDEDAAPLLGVRLHSARRRDRARARRVGARGAAAGALSRRTVCAPSP